VNPALTLGDEEVAPAVVVHKVEAAELDEM